MAANPPIVSCPQCGDKSVFAPSNAWRPFCSERCKKIDFGAWASEEFRVGGNLEDLDPGEASDLAQSHNPKPTLH